MNVIDSNFLSFLLVTVLLTVSPGVDTFLVIRNIMRGGGSDGVFTSFGICSGLFIHAILSVFGVSVLLVKSAYLFQAMKTLGALYLCWLGCVSLVSAVRGNRVLSTRSGKSDERSKAGSFREGLFSNILNPKPAIFYLAFFPQFIRESDHVLLEAAILVLVQFLIGLSWLIVLSFSFYKMRRIINSSFWRRIIETIAGSFLLAFGFNLFFANKR